MKKLRITVDGKVFDVVVESLDGPLKPAASQPASTPPGLQQTNVAPPPASSAPKPPAAAAAAGAGAVTSPLAGRVVSIDCQVGQSVSVGTQLATIEAMKMNTFVYAESEGTVETVLVNPADAVEEGQVLITLS